MTKTIKATLLAAALAVSSVAATPARAGSDTEKAALFILGAAALVAIANDANRKSKKQQQQVHKAPPPPTVSYGYSNGQKNKGKHNGYDEGHKGHGQKGRPAVLPVSCMRTVDGPSYGRHDARYVMSESCLQQSGVRQPLPQSCAVPVPSRHGPQRGYSANCLIGKGYVVGDLRH